MARDLYIINPVYGMQYKEMRIFVSQNL